VSELRYAQGIDPFAEDRLWMNRSTLPLVLGCRGGAEVAQERQAFAEEARDVARAVVGHHALDRMPRLLWFQAEKLTLMGECRP
jgi:hypothetical protein